MSTAADLLSAATEAKREKNAGLRRPSFSEDEESNAGLRRPSSSEDKESNAGLRRPGFSEDKESNAGLRRPSFSEDKESAAVGKLKETISQEQERRRHLNHEPIDTFAKPMPRPALISHPHRNLHDRRLELWTDSNHDPMVRHALKPLPLRPRSEENVEPEEHGSRDENPTQKTNRSWKRRRRRRRKIAGRRTS